MNRHSRWSVIWLAVAVMLLASPGWVQEAREGGEGTEPESDVLVGEELDVSRIEQILRGEQEVLEGRAFTYDPAGRRDPFRSLLEGLQEDTEGYPEARPPGLAGMLVEELRLEGIIETPTGVLAFVQGRDGVSYIIRPGTKLYNGEVKDIFPGRVVFRQQVNDPKQLKPYQEVVREIAD